MTDTRVWVDDVNGDGKLDILVGDNVSLISSADGLSEDEFKKRLGEWKRKMKIETLKYRKNKIRKNKRTGEK